jgi:hypothetical protein
MGRKERRWQQKIDDDGLEDFIQSLDETESSMTGKTEQMLAYFLHQQRYFWNNSLADEKPM